MTIKPVSINTFSVRGDRDGDIATETWFNSCGESRKVGRNAVCQNELGYNPGTQTIRQLKKDGFQSGVQASDINAIAQKVNQFIDEKNAAALEKLLKRNFIYPDRSSVSTSQGGDRQSDFFVDTDETYNARPNIEALFVHGNSYFATMIDSLIKANDEALYTAFLHSIVDTDLAKPDLFSWDDNLKANILIRLNDLRDHGKLLSAEDNIAMNHKGKIAKALADDLAAKVITRPVVPAVDNKSRFENLKFKLQLVRELHNNDRVFDQHVGWKRFVTNVCSFLFTLGVANYINYKMTGQALFFNKTTSQQKLLNSQGAIGFTPDETLSFKL